MLSESPSASTSVVSVGTSPGRHLNAAQGGQKYRLRGGWVREREGLRATVRIGSQRSEK